LGKSNFLFVEPESQDPGSLSQVVKTMNIYLYYTQILSVSDWSQALFKIIAYKYYSEISSQIICTHRSFISIYCEYCNPWDAEYDKVGQTVV
jgi:hypothetical protein